MHSAAARLLTLEDEFTDLEIDQVRPSRSEGSPIPHRSYSLPAAPPPPYIAQRHIHDPTTARVQVAAALLQAGGSLEAARALCRRLAANAAVPPTNGDAHAASAAQQSQQRHWWPRSEFCAAAATAPPVSPPVSRPSLVPHHMLPGQARTPPAPAQQQHQGGMQQPSPGVSGRPSAPSLKRPASGSSSPAGPGSSGARYQPPGLLARSSQPATPGSSSSNGFGVGSGPAGGATPASGFPGAPHRAAPSPIATMPQPPPPPEQPPPRTAPSPVAAMPQPSQPPQQPPRAVPSPTAALPRPLQQLPPQPQGLHPHYAAVFLSERAQQMVLQHVPPLHEAVTADHMTLSYKPTPAQCRQLPLGSEAQLFVEGAAADYRAQARERAGGGQKGGWGRQERLLPARQAPAAVCSCWSVPNGVPSVLLPLASQALVVQHPSWLPFLSESQPHITVSGAPAAHARCCAHMHACHGLHRTTRLANTFRRMLPCAPLLPSPPHLLCVRAVGDGVPAQVAGDVAAAALGAGQVAPVARLKLLQGGRGWVRVGGQAGMLGWMGIGGKGWASPTCTAMWRRKRSGWWERGWACATPAYIVLSSGNAVHAVQAASMRHSPGQLDVCCHDAVLPLRYMPACRHGGRAAV